MYCDPVVKALAERRTKELEILSDLQQEIDRVYGICIRDGNKLWCNTHWSSMELGADRCYSWEDNRDGIQIIIDNLKDNENEQ